MQANGLGRIERGLTVFVLTVLGGVTLPAMAFGLQEEAVREAVRAGEFTMAIEQAAELEGDLRDRVLGTIAAGQMQSGAGTAALETVRTIREDQIRTRVLGNLFRSSGTGGRSSDQSGGGWGPVGSPPPPGQFRPASGRGGITIGDFQPLMDLIKSTIAPDSWDDSNGDGTMFPYVSGVHVDANGELHRIRQRPDRALDRIHNESRWEFGNRQSGSPATLRKVSLTRLERELQLRQAQGLAPTREMQSLAGLTGIDYLLFYPESGDIVIAGPAGPVTRGSEGVWVNAQSGHPVLHLDDLVACLRNAFYENGQFGCSIEPRPKNLAATREFLDTSKLKGRSWREGLREQLGNQDIVVFGLDPGSHAARVIVEADYRMKLVGMGLEPGVPGVPSYLERLEQEVDGGTPPFDLVRWWFTMNYDAIESDPSGRVYRLRGTGVKVLSENEMLDRLGQRVMKGKADPHAAGFAADFTRHFEELATAYPAYRQLQNVFDLALVSAVIHHRNLDEEAGWDLTFFGRPEDSTEAVYQLRRDRAMEEVGSVMNHRIVEHQRDGRRFRTTLVGVSGGVRFDSRTWLENGGIRELDDEGLVREQKEGQPRKLAPDHWWWD